MLLISTCNEFSNRERLIGIQKPEIARPKISSGGCKVIANIMQVY